MQGDSEILWLYENSMGPNYIYSYSKSHSYPRATLALRRPQAVVRPDPPFLLLSTEEFRYIVVMRKLDGILLYLQL